MYTLLLNQVKHPNVPSNIFWFSYESEQNLSPDRIVQGGQENEKEGRITSGAKLLLLL